MRSLKGWAWVGVVGLSLAACGGSDDAGLSSKDAGSGGSAGSGTGGGNTGGASTGGAAGSGTGGGNTGGASTGGTAGSGTGGAAGSGTGGTAGSGTGGAAGSGTGGAAGSGTGGTAGSGTGGSGTGGSGGVTFINSGPCPNNPPTVGANCQNFAMCCYQASGTPFVCTGGSGTNPHWTTVPNRECCPATVPAAGSQCNTPGAITCCYPGGGLFCNTQPNPDVWASKGGCN